MKKIKWLFGLCLIVLVVCGSGGSVQAYSSSHVTDDGIRYETYTDSDEVTITGYNGTNETVIIPSEIDGKPVTYVLGSFFDTQVIKSCTIPEGVYEIGNDIHWILREQTALETVSLPSTLETIGDGVFSNCINLKEIILPKGLITIGEGTFYECSGLEKVIIPESVTSIENKIFKYCHNLKEIKLPEGLMNIGDSAFYDCGKLTDISLPEGLTSIGEIAFCGCYSIEKLIIPDSVTQIGEDAFILTYENHIPIYGNPDSYAKIYADTNPYIKFSCINHSNIVTDPAIEANCREYGKTEGSHCTICGTYVVKPQTIPPNGQHKWDEKVLSKATVRHPGRKNVTCTICHRIYWETIPKIPMPKKGETISDPNNSYTVTKSDTKNGTVEYKGTKIVKTNIVVPNTVKIDGITYKITSISKNAFKNNKNLKKVTIGQNIAKINANAFYGCKNLKTVTVKSTEIKSIGKNAFKGINSKAKIKVPKSKLKSYKNIFAKKGQKNTVKITK